MKTLQEVKEELMDQLDFDLIYKLIVVMDQKIFLDEDNENEFIYTFPNIEELKRRAVLLIDNVYESKEDVISMSGGFSIHKIVDPKGNDDYYSIYTSLSGISGRSKEE